jgi:hypothetical protein
MAFRCISLCYSVLINGNRKITGVAEDLLVLDIFIAQILKSQYTIIACYDLSGYLFTERNPINSGDNEK